MSERLDRLLRPRSLAFIGGAAAELAIEASRSFGFDGEMWGVNPRRELRGALTVGSVAELPGVADAAFVAVARDTATDVVRELAAAGTGAAVCYASGFAETGDTGAAAQRELVEAAAGMPLVGPNCYGTLSAVTGAALWPDVHGLARCERGVALVSQSGNVAVNLTMARRGLAVAHVLALGNQADVGLAESTETLVADPAVTGVGLYLEAVDDIDRFAAAMDVAHQRRLPVVALKLGATEASGAIAVTPHRLAGGQRHRLRRPVSPTGRAPSAHGAGAARHAVGAGRHRSAAGQPTGVAELLGWRGGVDGGPQPWPQPVLSGVLTRAPGPGGRCVGTPRRGHQPARLSHLHLGRHGPTDQVLYRRAARRALCRRLARRTVH
ncbi:CoA-binding protein [Candidatus Poriferisodalis sp.]|uniref:CoA-binding protein n=1 Tax=Candidatus Poriferisodalis sp. TaxID=3101277 RepID=UPI003B51AAC1